MKKYYHTDAGAAQPNHGRSAFTLVELLVVIAIIGILVAMLLPAVQSAREAARRSQCANNFKQVGLACQNYLSAKKTFPDGLDMWAGASCGRPPSEPVKDFHGWGWGTFILPFMEESTLYDQFDFTEGTYSGTKSFVAGGNFVKGYLCPSSIRTPQLMGCCGGKSNGGNPNEDLAETHMAGVADSVDWTCNGQWPKVTADGMMFQRSRIKPSKVTDGLSKTLLIGEVINNPDDGSYSGFFYVTWDVLHTANGINQALRKYVSPFSVTGNSFASYHPGGCHFVMSDGSVHFMDENISPSVLAALTTRAGSEVPAFP